MRVYSGEVHQGKSGWDINSDDELCSIDQVWVDTLPVSVDDNIRLHSDETGRDAAYTIARTHDDGGSQWIRMGSAARDKLYDDDTETTPSTFPCGFVPSVPNQRSRSVTEADSRWEMWEESVVHPSHEYIVTAPHGGDIEYNTEIQAQTCHDYLANSSLWACHGHGGVNGAFERWHLTSTDLHPNSFPGLADANAVDYSAAVSFHGYSGDKVLVGGAAPLDVREAVVAALDEIDDTTVELASDESLDGDSPDNFVNWLAGGDGIQIEQSYSFRDTHAEESAQRVAKAILNHY